MKTFKGKVIGGGVVTFYGGDDHRCVPPADGWFFARWSEGDQWTCNCGRTWTRWENYAGGGWA